MSVLEFLNGSKVSVMKSLTCRNPQLSCENGENGRDAGGRFAIGNAGGPGNPHAKRVAELRTMLLDAVTDDDLRAIIRALVARARDGDLAAIRELLDRIIGRPAQQVTVEAPRLPQTITVTPEQQRQLNDFRDRMYALADAK